MSSRYACECLCVLTNVPRLPLFLLFSLLFCPLKSLRLFMLECSAARAGNCCIYSFYYFWLLFIMLVMAAGYVMETERRRKAMKPAAAPLCACLLLFVFSSGLVLVLLFHSCLFVCVCVCLSVYVCTCVCTDDVNEVGGSTTTLFFLSLFVLFCFAGVPHTLLFAFCFFFFSCLLFAGC
jgi:hypothetical protein